MNILGVILLFPALLLVRGEHDSPSSEDFNSIVARIELLENSLAKTEHALKAKGSTIQRIQTEISSLNTELDEKAVAKQPEIPELHSYENFECEGYQLILECPSGRNISLTNAEYGIYTYPCDTGTCCNPHPTDDCVESMEQYHFPDWVALQITCANQTRCEVNVNGATLYTCGEGIFDYAHVFYSCLPEPVSGIIAFTAYSTTTVTYAVGETIVFDGTITNFGNYYNTGSGLFTCPISGVYFFSLSLGGDGAQVSASIVTEAVSVTTARCHNSHVSQGSTTAVIECTTGERVWAEIVVNGPVYGHATYKYTSFTGYLMESY